MKKEQPNNKKRIRRESISSLVRNQEGGLKEIS